MSEYETFSETEINNAIATAQLYSENLQSFSDESKIDIDDGHLQVLAQCIELTIKNRRVCLKLPLGIGKICIPVPISYDGKLAKACLRICTTWGIPTGVKVSVSAGGVVIVQKTFGKC